MKLDSKIKEGKKPLTCFDTEQAKEFLGKECYFSNCKSHYKNLSAFKKFESLTDYCIGELTAIMDLGDRVFDVDQQCNEFRYCLPCEWVKEPKKKYRPYTVMEFVKYYPLGSHLHFRLKDGTIEMHRLVDGYNDCKNGSGTLFMCGVLFSMSELYDDYEIFKDGEWQPFGVIDDEKK